MGLYFLSFINSPCNSFIDWFDKSNTYLDRRDACPTVEDVCATLLVIPTRLIMSFPRKRESILLFFSCRGRIHSTRPYCKLPTGAQQYILLFCFCRGRIHSTRPYCGLDKSSPYLDRRGACPTFEGKYYIVSLCHCEHRFRCVAIPSKANVRLITLLILT